ncbi:ParB/RepB/Spo0J family partition protein [Candidatus Pacearchaeota archaeon]|jgi:hypothetical protein|nr:ParB/RepB/Spo0J family partition protein [Candidatus Pacearchaeota archaeon]
MKIKISQLSADGGTQPRARINLEAVEEYAEAMRSGTKFPPVVVFYDGESYWLADGFHRRDAAIQAGLDDLLADVKQGTLRDAILYSVGVNSSHGLRRTNEDKRRAVMRLLEDAEWGKWSDREIADKCAVGHNLVSTIRRSLSPKYSEPPAERTYTTKHGATATMDTSRIGKRESLDPLEEEPGPREDGPTEKPAVIKKISPKASITEAKRSAAYSAIETFIDSLDAVERVEEIKTMRAWLAKY